MARARLALSLLVGAAFFATVPGTLAATPAPTDGKDGALWQQFAAKVGAIEAQTDGVLGVAVMDLKSGHEWSLRGHERFPQASTIKIAVLAELLRQDEAGDGAHLSDRYVVKRMRGRMTCTCPDFVHRGQVLNVPCKHVRIVRLPVLLI